MKAPLAKSALGILFTSLTLGCGLVDGATSAPGTLVGTVDYHGTVGTEGRALSVAVYDRLPPSGPPLRALLLERYELPYTFVFEGLPPGGYFVGALIDVDRMDTRYAGMLNEALDPYGYVADGQPVFIDASTGASGLAIRLEDPR